MSQAAVAFGSRLLGFDYVEPVLSAQELSSLLPTEDAGEVTPSVALALFRAFQAELQRFETETPCYRLFSATDAFVLMLSDPAATSQEAKDVAKLPDVIANVSRGKLDLGVWYKRIVRTILLCRCLESRGQVLGWLPVMVETLCLNYSFVDGVMEEFVTDCLEHPFEGTAAYLGSVIQEVPAARQECVLRPVLAHAKSSVDLTIVLGTAAAACQGTFEKLLLSRRTLPSSVHPKLARYLSKCSTPGELLALLEKALALWGDPVIAKAYVTGEIMHYTKISLLLFFYASRTECLRSKSRIIERLVRGLPHHFGSTDGRTVMLAKFFSEVITESLKHFEDQSHCPPGELASPEEPICRDLLTELRDCEDSQLFWFVTSPSAPATTAAEHSEVPDKDKSLESDDDDSDLEAIESVSPPSTCKVRYIRNFLELFPETKSHAEVRDALRAVPSVIKHQLALDHPQMGKDLLNMIFSWENEFEDPNLDDQRKTCLVSVLESRLDGNLEYFCQMFHRDHVQPYRKNLVLDVLSKVAKSANLKDLQLVCNASFRLLLLDRDTINKQEVTVRIPFVLYLSRLLCLLPEQMLTEEAVVNYLSALNSLREVDAATEQTVCYALNNVMSALGDKKLAANVQMSIRDTRDWLLAIQANR